VATTLDQLVIRLEADIKGLKAGLAQAGSEVRKFSNDASQETNKFTVALGRVGVAAVALSAVLATIGVMRGVFQAGVQVESLNGKMLAAVGSAQAAQQSLQWLREESERLGLRFTTTADAFASFSAAATRAGLTLEQTRNVFLGVSEAAVAFRLSNERVQFVFQALSQIAAKGVVSMEELRQQLGEHLPIAMDAAARGMGVTQAKLIDMVSKGEVASKDFLPAFGRAIRENLGDAVEVSSQSANAGFNRLMNAIDSLKQTMAGGGFLNSFSAAFDALATVVSQPGLVNALKNIVAVIAKIAQVVAESIAGIAIMVNKLIELKHAALGFLGFGDGKIPQANEKTAGPMVEAGSYNPSAGGGVSASMEKASRDRERMMEQLRSKIDAIKYDVASPAEKLKIDLEEELKVLKEGLEAKLLTEQEFRDLSLEAEAKFQEELGEIRDREAKEEERRQRELEDSKKAIRDKGYNAAMGLLGVFASKNKAFAIAMIAIEKARAIASVLIAGQEAGMKAAAAAARAGPQAAAAAYASMVNMSRVSAALIAAQGFAEAAMGLGKGGGGGDSSGGYGVDSFTGTGGGVAAPTQTKQVFINLDGQGELFTKNQVRTLIEQINDAVADGTQLKVAIA